MTSLYHSGEKEVQERVGVRQMAERVSRIMQPFIPPVVHDFIKIQSMLVAASVDAQGHVWASLLTGQPGFVQALDETTLQITEPRWLEGDPLRANLEYNSEIGILLIEFASRLRMRLNGQAFLDKNGNIQVLSRQVYSNCQKYIQKRQPLGIADNNEGPVSFQKSELLSPSKQRLIENADTFFVASYNSEGGADASHRGGLPGFVRVENGILTWPDYIGNKMFNTLGNIQSNPNTGLLFLDFEQGNILQLTGKAHIVWDEARVKTFAGAERLVEFEPEEILEFTGANPLRWDFKEYSHYNPAF
jgi:predicted pyridoxine 5'-phosphate oxidase superfamily flavin-nucleotide-binding protein